MGRLKQKTEVLELDSQIELAHSWPSLADFFNLMGLDRQMTRLDFYEVCRGDPSAPEHVQSVEIALANASSMNGWSNKVLVGKVIAHLNASALDEDEVLANMVKKLAARLLFI